MKITNLSVCENGIEGDEEEEYIDMEVSSSPSLLHCCSSPQSREFEFQMCAASDHPPTTASPADHLFHKGKLLPLYLLPAAAAEDAYSSLPATAAATPFDSCNISPSESRRVSCDLNSSDDSFFFEWSSELKTFIHHHPAKTPWPKRLNLIKTSAIAHKLRASRNYLRSLFVKSACSADSAAKPQNPSNGGGGGEIEIPHKLLRNPKRKALETAPYPTIAAIINNIEIESAGGEQRRSFSSAIKRHSPTKCLSSSSSNSSSGSSSFSLNENQCLRRSSSATDIEGSIEAAIAHCKKSQQQIF